MSTQIPNLTVVGFKFDPNTHVLELVPIDLPADRVLPTLREADPEGSVLVISTAMPVMHQLIPMIQAIGRKLEIPEEDLQRMLGAQYVAPRKIRNGVR